MSGLDLRIDRLVLGADVPAEHRHRIEGITHRALAVFETLARAELVRLGAHGGRARLDTLSGGEVAVDLAREGDEEVAGRIARAWLDTLRLALG
ncbi:hypothetical protein RMN57_07560 [Kitasatospora sp. CM 4170]|uniref:Uncharacterized protein n=1 Tax=Kitasatospora aburaviensis TaxID=67265 RepID=A0ABW1ER43_9ACTN|nr:hypothetical protein [Kitasatospora sp. CM 4170]WNM44578.1 hypothetical protein RMN57_07560 [Kitasatospora sp. CM 4170]